MISRARVMRVRSVLPLCGAQRNANESPYLHSSFAGLTPARRVSIVMFLTCGVWQTLPGLCAGDDGSWLSRRSRKKCEKDLPGTRLFSVTEEELGELVQVGAP
jgi:hypothetical protein